MIGTILKKEFLLQLYSARFLTMILLVVLLAVAGSLFMIQDYSLRLENYEVLRPTDGESVAIRPPSAMSVYVKGLDEIMGRSISIYRGFGQLNIDSSQSSANRMFMLFRQLDYQFIVSVVLSLAAMLFTFDAFSGEKQEGTLKLNLANPLSRAKLVLAKWLSLIITTLIPFLVATLIILLFIFILLPDITGGDFTEQTLYLIAGGVAYLVSFVSIGMFISVLNKSRSTSMIIGLLVWAVVVFVLPNSMAVISKTVAGADAVNLMEIEQKRVWFEQTFKNSNARFNLDEGLRFQKETGNRFSGLLQRYNNSLRQQVGNLQMTAVFSPTQAFNLYSWSVTGTGPQASLHFNEAVIRYQNIVIEDSLADTRLRSEGKQDEIEYRQFNSMPREPHSVFLTEALPGLAVLLLYSFALLGLTVFFFNRYDVR